MSATAAIAETRCANGHCITCSDEAVAMIVLRIDEDRVLALCADGEGSHHTVEAGLVAPLSPGDRVLVHAAVAIASLQPQERV